MRNFKDYNKTELFSKIDKLEVEKVDGQVITKYEGRVINICGVSERYEVFDITKYLKEKINQIEENFTITKYNLRLTRGIQSLQLISDPVNIGGVDFWKSFFILNSTDKSRTLSFHLGLQSDKVSIVGIKNIGLVKKHLTGLNKDVEEASQKISHETFSEQIESMSSLVGHKVLFSKVRQTILGDSPEVPQVNHKKFDSFKWAVVNSTEQRLGLSKDQLEFLYKSSVRIFDVPADKDFYLDAYWVLLAYLGLFNQQDSHIIKNETARIMNITQWAVRNNLLEALGI